MSSLEFFQKQTNEFVFTSMRCVFVCYLEEIEASKKEFWNYLTFKNAQPEIQIVKGIYNQYYGNSGLATTILIRIFPPNGLRWKEDIN